MWLYILYGTIVGTLLYHIYVYGTHLFLMRKDRQMLTTTTILEPTNTETTLNMPSLSPPSSSPPPYLDSAIPRATKRQQSLEMKIPLSMKIEQDFKNNEMSTLSSTIPRMKNHEQNANSRELKNMKNNLVRDKFDLIEAAVDDIYTKKEYINNNTSPYLSTIEKKNFDAVIDNKPLYYIFHEGRAKKTYKK